MPPQILSRALDLYLGSKLEREKMVSAQLEAAHPLSFTPSVPQAVMFLPTRRISLRIPDSPIEKQTFRSRSFRKILASICTLFLIIASLHSITARPTLRQEIAQDYFKIYQHSNTLNWLSRSHPSDESNTIETQTSPERSRKLSAGKSDTLDHLMRELPEVVRIPFEEAVRDVTLEGWEDDWLSSAFYDPREYGSLEEPKIDFVYNWVNGSDDGFKATRRKYELASPLNDNDGKWIAQHSINRYRDWDELRYSFRSLDKYARTFINKVQLLVNSVSNGMNNDTAALRPQRPRWLKNDEVTREDIQVLPQENFFDGPAKECLPSFDSLSLETQIFNTPSTVDQLVALSDDMFLSAPHSAADFFSPLFGPMFAFKRNHYNVKNIGKADIPTFGEKPYLYYTSWLLNHRFGERDRKVQAHFTHSVSRRVMKEAMASFPSPSLRGSCERFRGESKYQIYPWYTAFHYSIERFREALLWSLITMKSDTNGDGYLDWSERQLILDAIRPGRKSMASEDPSTPASTAKGRDRIFYQVDRLQERAGLQPPLSNVNVLWTSLDGPETIRDVKCNNFYIDKCFAESFDSPVSDASYRNPDFTTSNIFTQLSRREPKCGDCVIKFMLSTTRRGLEPLLPPKSKYREREMVIKALIKYQHTVVEPDALFVMVKDAEQAETELLDRTLGRKKQFGQWCLNDDVMTEDSEAVAKVNSVIQTVFQTLLPHKSRWER